MGNSCMPASNDAKAFHAYACKHVCSLEASVPTEA